MPKLMIWNPPTGSFIGAVAVLGRRKLIMVSSSLLSVLSKREVDAILAHELAHFRQKRRAVRFLLIAPIGGLLFGAVLLDHKQQIWAVLAAFLLVLLQFAWKRGLELASDKSGAEICGDPAALATALTKLTTMNDGSITGSPILEIFLTHPWTAKRVARLGYAPAAVESDPSASSYDSASELEDRPVALFLDGIRKFAPLLLRWIWTIALLAGAAAWFSNAHIPVSEAISSAIVFVVAVSGGLAFISSRWTRSLRNVAATLQASIANLRGIDWPEATLCGMAPGIGRTIFDTGYDWDIGLVRLSGDTLCYAGDRAAFALPRTEVKAVEMRPGPPIRFRPMHVVCLSLTHAAPGSFVLKVIPDVPGEGKRRLAFFESLRQWHAGSTGPQPDPIGGLPALESVNWPQGPTALRRVVGVRDFLRLVFLAVVPVALFATVVWGWQFTPQTILPPAVALTLVLWFAVRGLLLREETILPDTEVKTP